MPSFWRHVKKVLDQAEIVIEVLDARFVEESRNKELEDKIIALGKKLLFVVNKSDIATKEHITQAKKTLAPCVFISSTDKLGTTILKKKILELSRGKEVIVGVVGYPNVGKSSVINALSGKNAARTSAQSGFTKGLQKVRVDNKIMILDTPGVYPYKEKDQFRLGKIGAIDAMQLKDPEGVALELLEKETKRIKDHYNLKENDPEDLLEELAQVLGKLLKGGKPDIELTARTLLKDWQRGEIEQ